jgi:hypothetical protein
MVGQPFQPQRAQALRVIRDGTANGHDSARNVNAR